MHVMWKQGKSCVLPLEQQYRTILHDPREFQPGPTALGPTKRAPPPTPDPAWSHPASKGRMCAGRTACPAKVNAKDPVEFHTLCEARFLTKTECPTQKCLSVANDYYDQKFRVNAI